MLQGSSGTGESLNAAEGQRQGRWPFESPNKPAQDMSGAGECKYCGTQHRRGPDQCLLLGNHAAHAALQTHCMKRGQQAHQLNAMDAPPLADRDDDNCGERQKYTAMSMGAVNTQGKSGLLPDKGVQRCQLDCAPRMPLQSSLTILKLYNSAWMNSMGLFSTQCIIRGKTHRLDFEVVVTSQTPLLSGETCETLGLTCFTIPEELNNVVHCEKGVLNKERLISTYHDVFPSSIESLPGDVHFELDTTVAPVQCAPRNVPVALKAAVRAQLDQYERDGHLTTVTQPTD